MLREETRVFCSAFCLAADGVLWARRLILSRSGVVEEGLTVFSFSYLSQGRNYERVW